MIVKNKSTEFGRQFWEHIEAIAEQVRAKEQPAQEKEPEMEQLPCGCYGRCEMMGHSAVVAEQRNHEESEERLANALKLLAARDADANVVERMMSTLLREGCKVSRRAVSAALSVATEGYVPASEYEEACKVLRIESEAARELKQQLATMVTTDAVVRLLSDYAVEGGEPDRKEYPADTCEELIARLTSKPQKQEPTPQEKAAPLDIAYFIDFIGIPPRICGICGVIVSDQVSHTGWHNNIGDAERYARARAGTAAEKEDE